MKYFGTRYYSPAALLLLLLVGCKGKIGAPEGLPGSRDTTQPAAVQPASPSTPLQPSGDTGSSPGGMLAAGDSPAGQGMDKPVQGPRYQCSRPELRGTNQMSLRRLTKDEYLQSAAAVFGAAVVDAPEVQQAAAQIPAETTGDITREFQNAPSYDHVAGILMTAQAIANTVVGNAATSARIFGACAEHADRDCAAKFLTGGATRISRRPIDAQRRVAMLDAFTFAGEGDEGLKLLLARVLQAPEAVFHMAWPRQQCTPAANSISEQEETCIDEAPQGAAAQVDDWTVADRIAYALTGHGPDQELLDAAALGELRSPDQARPHAVRLLKLPEARKQLEAILDSWLTLRTLPTPAQAVAENAGIDVRDLGEEARRELLDYAVWEILDNDADAQTLMIDPVGFPRSERMAMLYGVSAIAKGTEPVDLVNGHGGLLVRIAPLLSGQLRTSPILRGVYVRKRLLCDELLQPDFAVVQARTESLHALDQQKLSSREIAQKITEPSQCMACHTQINPLGFILEGFDALGVRRDEELELNEKGQEIAALPIVTQVDQANIEDGAPQQLADAAELVRTLATSTKYQACIAERFYTQTQMRHPSATDLCALSEIEAVVRGGKSVKEAWLATVLNADTFIRKAAQ